MGSHPSSPGGYVCTEDCGGRLCRAPDVDAGQDDAGQRDAGTDGGLCSSFTPPCSHDYQCRDGERCVRGVGCNPSACGCDPSSGAINCTADCSGGLCRPGAADAGACVGFVSPCSSNAQCGPGTTCQRNANVCMPSACGCDPGSGAIVCTADFGGGVCAPTSDAGVFGRDGGPVDAGLCAGFEPPCANDLSCERGRTCRQPLNACVPSACACDPQSGSVVCTADCNGRLCL